MCICDRVRSKERTIVALIQCPECGKDISDKAETCPHCGCPMKAKPDIVNGRQVQTIEKTAKQYKGQMVLSTIMLLVGIILLIGTCAITQGPSVWLVVPILIMVLAALWYIVAWLSAWWHHA